MFTNINHVHGKNIQAIKMFSFLKYLLHLRSQLIILLPISLKKNRIPQAPTTTTTPIPASGTMLPFIPPETESPDTAPTKITSPIYAAESILSLPLKAITLVILFSLFTINFFFPLFFLVYNHIFSY